MLNFSITFYVFKLEQLELNFGDMGVAHRCIDVVQSPIYIYGGTYALRLQRDFNKCMTCDICLHRISSRIIVCKLHLVHTFSVDKISGKNFCVTYTPQVIDAEIILRLLLNS